MEAKEAVVTVPTPNPAPAPIVFEAAVLAVLIAFAAAGVVMAVRKKLGADVKGLLGTALACDLCSAWWATIVVTLGWWYAVGHPIKAAAVLFFVTVGLAGVGLATLLLKVSAALDAASVALQVVEKSKD